MNAIPVVVPVPVVSVKSPLLVVAVWFVETTHVAPVPAAGPTVQEKAVLDPIYFGVVKDVLA